MAMMGAAQFLAGNPFLAGSPYGADMAGMAQIAGMQQIAGNPFLSGPEFVAGNDPVSALLGMGPGPMDMSGSWYNPVSWFRHGGGHPAAPAHPAVAMQQAAINAKLAQHGAAVVDQQNQYAIKTISPVTTTVIGAGLNATPASQPQALFRAERFVIPASLAPSFTVQDIKVGNVSQFPNTGDIPGEMFAQNSFDTGIRLRTVNPALNLSVAVTNITGGSLTFRAGFFGTLVQ